MVEVMARRWGRGDKPEDIARDNDLSEATLHVLASSDAFKAIAAEELAKMKGEGAGP